MTRRFALATVFVLLAAVASAQAQDMTFRFYRTAQIGTGTRNDAFRSAMDRYIVADGSGQNFWDWIHDGRPLRYVLARATTATHLTAELDPDITPVSPEMPDLEAVRLWLDSPVLADVTLTTTLENDGISTSWASQQTTRRQVFRFLSRLHVVTQDIRRIDGADALRFFREGLDTSISQVPPAVREAFRTWMQSKGLDAGWITGSTTVRQVVHYVMSNIDWTILALGPVTPNP